MPVPSLLFHHLTTRVHHLLQALRQWSKPNRTSLAHGAVSDFMRSKSDLMLENALQRQQLIVLERQVKRPQLMWRERGIMVLLSSWLKTWKVTLLIVQPDTVLRWHRDFFRLVWRLKSRSQTSPGRPAITAKKIGLIQRLAHENRLWGAERIRGELLKLGFGVARSTVQKYVQRLRSAEPSDQTWATFLRNHASEIWACDFLQTYDVLFRTIYVFVIIELESRRVLHFNVTRHPTDAWIAQQLREATPFGEGPGYLIRDNDGKFGAEFTAAAHGANIDVLPTPVEAPRANAFCERFLGSVRRECLDYILILSQRHLYRVVKEYVTFFNHARPHQGINQQIPCVPTPLEEVHADTAVIAHPVLGGLHHDYRQAA